MESSKEPFARSRRTFVAAAVGVLCAVAISALALLGGSGPEPAKAGAGEVGATGADGDAAHAHGGDLAVPGMSEEELRAFETATLGAAHAREHALLRSATEGDAQPTDPAPKLSAAAAAAPVGDPEDVGQWKPAKTPFRIVAIHAALLPTGKVMIFSYPTYPNRPNNAEAYLWDPAHPEVPPVLNNPPGKANIWCAGQTFTADGELLVFGGNLDYETPSATWKGLDKVFTFNPWTETWREQPKMNHGRWYPTGVRMADGRVPIVSGLDETGLLDPWSHTNAEVELFTPPDQPGGLGSIEKIGMIGDGATAEERAKKPIGQLYPRMVAMASGHTILAGPDKETSWYLDNVDANPFTWGDIRNLTRHRTWGTTVPLPSDENGPTKLMALGGNEWSAEPPTTTTEVFDEADPNGGWRLQSDNLYGRGHANTVLLPDGSMVQVGGGRGSSAGAVPNFPSELHYAEPEKRHIELWDPVTKNWRLGPAQDEARAYHSTALLLPDGRVMSAGDDYNGDPGKTDAGTDTDPNEDTAEIYEPPYLFRGNRPTITTAPATIGFNGSFGVDTPNTNITGAALVAPGAVTHGVDMNQRMLQLDVVQRTGCVSVTAPAGPTAAPPGHYMLFLLNDQGVPSVAKFVKLEQGGSLGGCGTAPPADVSPPSILMVEPKAGTVAGTIDVKATASDDRGVVGVRFERDGVLLADDTTSPYATTWNTTGAADGPHTIKATARDASGKIAEASVPVTVENTDTEGPVVNITTPAPGATVTGEIAVAATATDSSGVSQVQFKVDGTNIGGPDASVPFSVLWGSINVANGTHTLTAVASDTLGNERQSGVPVTVYNQDGKPVDALPPKRPPQTTPGETPGGGGGSGGGTPGGGNPTTPADAAPAFSRLKVSPARFRKGKRATIRFRLTEAGKVVASFERKLSGRRVRGRCVKPSRGARRNCTRYLRVRSRITVQGKAGVNAVRFRGKGLRVGRYRLTLLAKDASGKRSKPARASFRLLQSAAAAEARAARAAALAWF